MDNLNPAADGRNLIDFLNGDAVCVIVKEGSADSYHAFSFADSKEDSMDIIKRNFTSSILVEGSVVCALNRKLADVYMFYPAAYRSTSSQELWEKVCTVGNERIAKARKIKIQRKIAELDAERAALAAQLEG